MHIGGDIDCGTTGLTIAGMSGSKSIVLSGAGERAAKLTYSGTGDFITVGADDGNHSGAAAYNGTGPQLKMRDIRLAGPGIGSTARGLVDWENGSAVFERVLFDGWAAGYKGIGSDVVKFMACSFSTCAKGVFLASRCDQNTFDHCYFTQCTIGANVEYSWGSRFFACQFVFNTTGDIVYDAPASATDSGDIRLDIASLVEGCWFESASTPQLARHIWFGRNGVSSRFLAGLVVNGGYLLASNTLNFIEVEGGSVVRAINLFQGGGGGMSGSLVSITAVSGLTPKVVIEEPSKSGGTVLGGSVGASQSVVNGIRQLSANAFAASFNTDALGGELREIGALTANITINAPTNAIRGMHLTYVFLQDVTGGRTVTWNVIFKTNWSDAGNTASKRSTITFFYDGTNWIQKGSQSAYI